MSCFSVFILLLMLLLLFLLLGSLQTRKMTYRKDACVIYLYMGALKIFGSPWLMPPAIRLLFPKFLIDLFRSILRMCVQNLKFIVLPVP